nr:transposase, MuDR, MULE transposase domain protein [Tanacetum cinerariifolium]
MDGNNQKIPLATGVSQGETSESWTWFLSKLKEQIEAHENELCYWAAAKVYDRMLKSANWTVRPIDHLKIFQVFNKLKVHQVDLVTFQCSCRKWEEHLSEEARLDEERLRNGWVYIDWDDVQESEEPVTTIKGMAVEDWQAVQGRLDSYDPCINFLSNA